MATTVRTLIENSIYEFDDFNQDQLEVLQAIINAGVNLEQVNKIAQPKLSAVTMSILGDYVIAGRKITNDDINQINVYLTYKNPDDIITQVYLARLHGLSAEKIALFAKPDCNNIKAIRILLEQNSDITDEQVDKISKLANCKATRFIVNDFMLGVIDKTVFEIFLTTDEEILNNDGDFMRIYEARLGLSNDVLALVVKYNTVVRSNYIYAEQVIAISKVCESAEQLEYVLNHAKAIRTISELDEKLRKAYVDALFATKSAKVSNLDQNVIGDLRNDQAKEFSYFLTNIDKFEYRYIVSRDLDNIDYLIDNEDFYKLVVKYTGRSTVNIDVLSDVMQSMEEKYDLSTNELVFVYKCHLDKNVNYSLLIDDLKTAGASLSDALNMSLNNQDEYNELIKLYTGPVRSNPDRIKEVCPSLFLDTDIETNNDIVKDENDITEFVRRNLVDTFDNNKNFSVTNDESIITIFVNALRKNGLTGDIIKLTLNDSEEPSYTYKFSVEDKSGYYNCTNVVKSKADIIKALQNSIQVIESLPGLAKLVEELNEVLTSLQ